MDDVVALSTLVSSSWPGRVVGFSTKKFLQSCMNGFLCHLLNHLRKRPTTANLVKNGQKWPFSGAKKLGVACLNTNMRTIDVVNLVYDCSCGF